MLSENFFIISEVARRPQTNAQWISFPVSILKWLEKSVKRICKKLSEEKGHQSFVWITSWNQLFIIITAVHNVCIIRKVATRTQSVAYAALQELDTKNVITS